MSVMNDKTVEKPTHDVIGVRKVVISARAAPAILARGGAKTVWPAAAAGTLAIPAAAPEISRKRRRVGRAVMVVALRFAEECLSREAITHCDLRAVKIEVAWLSGFP